MPHIDSIMFWLSEDKEFSEKYARARTIQADVYAEKTIKIAEDATPENVQVAKLQVDTLKWHASKLLPKKYGDKTSDINLSQTTNTVVVMSEEQRREIMEQRQRLLNEEQKRLEE